MNNTATYPTLTLDIEIKDLRETKRMLASVMAAGTFSEYMAGAVTGLMTSRLGPA